MKRLSIFILSCAFALAIDPVIAKADTVNELEPTATTEDAVETATEGMTDEEVSTQSDISKVSDDIWKYKKKGFMVGFTTGTLDPESGAGEAMSSRWGIAVKTGFNIYLHRKPLGGFAKIGLDIDMEANYMNFAKGKGSFSDIMHPDLSGEDFSVSFGRHYLTGGIAIGPNVTFAPFFNSSNRNLAALKFRPYFHVVPSYASYIVSDEDETEFHNAFAFWCSAGLQIQWKRLLVDFNWKGSTAKYKGLLNNLISDLTGDATKSSESYKINVNMVNILIGISF